MAVFQWVDQDQGNVKQNVHVPGHEKEKDLVLVKERSKEDQEKENVQDQEKRNLKISEGQGHVLVKEKGKQNYAVCCF